MRFINLKRRNGKTTMLIHASYVTGYPIITSTTQMAHFIISQAKKMGFNDIRVYSLGEWQAVHRYCHEVENVLIDEAKDIIEDALKEVLGAKVVACTMSVPMMELISETEKTEENKGEK